MECDLHQCSHKHSMPLTVLAYDGAGEDGSEQGDYEEFCRLAQSVDPLVQMSMIERSSELSHILQQPTRTTSPDSIDPTYRIMKEYRLDERKPSIFDYLRPRRIKHLASCIKKRCKSLRIGALRNATDNHPTDEAKAFSEGEDQLAGSPLMAVASRSSPMIASHSPDAPAIPRYSVLPEKEIGYRKQTKLSPIERAKDLWQRLGHPQATLGAGVGGQKNNQWILE